MRNDLEVIVKQYPHDWDVLRLYAIGDVHVGAENFDEKAIKKKIDIIANDPHGVVALCGDLGDFGLKNSKTNVYHATMQPRQQIEYIYNLFLPVVNKVVTAVPGNHEERITREVGTCPLYDLCVRWGIEEVYRENVAILKLLFGSLKGGKQQKSFIVVTTHGSTRNKHRKYIGGYDNADVFISGHIHEPSYNMMGRIRIDPINATAKHVPCKSIIVDANLAPGGYGLKKEYEIPAPPELQYLELSSKRDSNRQRTVHKIMNYHAIQL